MIQNTQYFKQKVDKTTEKKKTKRVYIEQCEHARLVSIKIIGDLVAKSYLRSM